MKPRSHDPRRLDVEALAKDGDVLEGRWPLLSLERLTEAAHADAMPGDADAVTWRAQGERRTVRGGLPQTWLHLHAQAGLSLVCQRCLGPIQTPLDIQRSFLFVAGEQAAAEQDADSEDDVLALTHALDLRELVEDELLLALPLVPRHQVCPHPLPLGTDEEPAEQRPHPFAALAALKGDGDK